MPDLSIEEAYQAAICDCGLPGCKRANALIRDAMLAVLRERFDYPELPGSIYVAERDVAALFARIEALGSDDDD